ncbi:hypothetical protein QN277_000815 [Acacia crassicarpa]|uniref:Uncharacterized protein n=1 Tax=Acacia crassicarpa TaxID=499986 RepID=A0AAE1N652_9FABA|nr:hypothetical protein QN277_000815 [Acacia crassicarpa]
MNYLFWNCRGVGAWSFPGLIREINRTHRVDVLASLETRASRRKATKVASKLGFQNFHIVDAVGYNGGVWVLWNVGEWNIKLIDATSQFIHLPL